MSQTGTCIDCTMYSPNYCTKYKRRVDPYYNSCSNIRVLTPQEQEIVNALYRTLEEAS